MTADAKDQEVRTKREIEAAFVNTPLAGEQEMSPVPGMDWPTFRNYVMRALDGDATVPAAISNCANAAARLRNGAEKPEEQDDHFWREFFWRYAIEENLKVIDSLINRYNEMADQQHEQAEQARQRMREATDKLAAIDDFVSGVNDVFKDTENGEKVDREKAIRLLKSRGVDVDPNETEETLLIKLKKEKEKAQEERVKWSKQYDDSKADADYHDAQERAGRSKAQELVDRRDEIRRHGYDPQEENQQLQKVTDEYKLDVQKKAAEIERAKTDVSQENDIKAASLKSAAASQSAQTDTEASDFRALARPLTPKFSAAADALGEDPRSLPTKRNVPAPAGPGSPV